MPIQIKHTEFDLSSLFDGDDDPRMTIDRKRTEDLSRAFVEKWKDRDDYLANKEVLKTALDEYESWMSTCGPGGVEKYYFSMRSAQDEASPVLRARMNQINDFSDKIINDVMFFELRLGKIAFEKQQEFLAAEELGDYHAFLTRLFKRAKYLLSEKEEKIMNLKSSPAYSNWVKMLSSFLSREEREILSAGGRRESKSFSEILGFISHRNKEIRDDAAAALNDILLKNADVAENELNSILQDKKVNDELRGYARPDESRHIHDDIETEAVDALVAAVTGHFDLSKKYYELKAQLLGVDKLEYHERNIQYGSIEKEYSFAAGAELVHNVLYGLDAEFARIFQDFIDNGAIDVYPRKGKAGGAFCAYDLKTLPTYILLNYNDKLNDVTTLAHEVGHGINDELMKKKQNALNFGTSTATAEVASTFMEDFVLERIAGEADDELRLSIKMEKLNDLVSSIFRQVALYKFEQELHRDFRNKGYLSKEEIGKLFKVHMAAYMGDSVIQSPGSENWWVYWSHIRNYFYAYSYASGLLVSKYLQNNIKRNREFIHEIKKFLSSGTSASPKQIFSDLGVDITSPIFWNEGLLEIKVLLDETILLAKKLKKI